MNCRPSDFDEASILARYPASERPFPGDWPSRSGHNLAKERWDDDADLSWYVLRSATRREKVAEAGLIDAGFAVYVPKLTRWRRHAGRKERVDRALFDGYLFVGVAADQALCDVTSVDGVHNVIRFAAEADPLPVSFRRIEEILVAELNGAFDLTSRRKPEPEPGNRVRIDRGKFQGFDAYFVRRLPRDRIEVLLDMFGRRSPLQLKASEVDEFRDED